MKSLLNTPLEVTIAEWWTSIDDACKKAFFAAVCVNIVAFGFEMTNLTLNHDDVSYIFIQDTILGHYLGRFGLGWLHNYTQNHYFMPFLQMLEGILMMSAYGVLVAYFWGVRKATDLALMSAIICVFPYMGSVFQYNAAMAPYPAAHLLVALAVMVSTRATAISVASASILYVAAFSIYQSVAANAATIFVIWLLSRHLFDDGRSGFLSLGTVRSATTAVVSVLLGGVLYLGAVSMLNLEPDTVHASDDAFHLRGLFDPALGVRAIVQGTRSFFLWPESYFPGYLKALQVAVLVGAAAFCLHVPKRMSGKILAVALLVLAVFVPRSLQLLAPKGHFHHLSLTAYAILMAGAGMIVIRAGRTVTRNLSIVLMSFLVAGYVMQCNWISTVNYLNTLAHFSTLTQVLSRVRSIPEVQWDGRQIAVVGALDMPREYPFLSGATGVAINFMDASHMEKLARLSRDKATFVAADRTMPKVLEYAASHPAWPAPGSVGVVDGMGVVVFSKIAGAPGGVE